MARYGRVVGGAGGSVVNRPDEDDDVTPSPPDGLALIARERIRQSEVEAFGDAHDDMNANGEMAIAAACYAVVGMDGDENGLGAVEVLRTTNFGPWECADAWPWAPGWD